MRFKYISLFLFIPTLLCLFACTQINNTEIPEWKILYFDLIEKTLNGEMDARGIPQRHMIELFDYDEDGIPELQEKYSRGNQPEHHMIWFVEDGQIRAIRSEHQLRKNDNSEFYFEGLWKNNDSGKLVLTNYIANMSIWSFYRYFQTDDKGIWSLDSVVHWSTTGYPDAGKDEDYVYNDYASKIESYDGSETPIQNAQAEQLIKDFYAFHTRLQGEPFLLEALYPWSDESAKTISDYFNAYDGVASNLVSLSH